MAWHAQLQLDYSKIAGRSVARHEHSGPLRILQSLYPEGDGICHNVLVHPPGGLVGGDRLQIDIGATGNAHGLVTTPGASRFYRSSGELALQHTRVVLHDQARLEWLPMEAILYNDCLAQNQLQINLAPQAEMIGWDITALGLPHANKPFAAGSYCQHIEVPGVWLERGRIDATDQRLMHGPLGLAGHACMASLFFVAGFKLNRQRRQIALDAARATVNAHPLQPTAGVTSPNDQVVVLRVLSPVVEPAMHLFKQVWAAWRSALWGLPASSPRIWAT